MFLKRPQTPSDKQVSRFNVLKYKTQFLFFLYKLLEFYAE